MLIVPSDATDAFPSRQEALAFRLEDVPRVLRRMLDEALAGYGLSRTQWRLLAYVYREEGLTQTELARRLELERATIGLAVDALAKADFVVRRPMPEDRRVWAIFATRRAKDLLPELRVIGDEIMAKLFRGFSAAEISLLGQFLERMHANLDE